jgi:hypothetical protein
MLVCCNCWQKSNRCNCDRKNWIDIDDIIYPAIKKLNILGYETNFCCSGHTDNRGIQSYISFVWDKNTEIFKTLPINWSYDSYNYRKVKHYKYHIIRSVIPEQRKIAKMTAEQKQEIIDKGINNLIRWTETLEHK